jgi:hypothetical protein
MKLNAAETKLVFAAAQRQVTILQARIDKVRDRLAETPGFIARDILRTDEAGLKREIIAHRRLATLLHHSSELPADVEVLSYASVDLGEFANYTSSMETSRAIEALIEKLEAERRNLYLARNPVRLRL